MNRRSFLAVTLGAAASVAADARLAIAQTPNPVKESAMPKYEWIKVTTDAPFAGRDGAGALTFKGRMWLLGGWNPDDKTHFPKVCNSEVWSSVDGKEWRQDLKAAPWEGRHTAGYVVHNDRMWIVGGDPIQGHYQDDVWSSADGVDWTRELERAPWGPRVLHYTVVHGGKIWVFGGQTLPQFAPEKEAFYSDAWCSADGKKWERAADQLPWGPRGMIGGSTVHNGKIWMLGGGTYDTPARPRRDFHNDVWASPDGVTWDRVAEKTPWHPRQYHDVAVWDDKLWVMEGYHQQGGNRKDVWWSSDGVNWNEVPGTPWPPRHAASLFVHDDALWMVAGNNMTPDVWRLRRS